MTIKLNKVKTNTAPSPKDEGSAEANHVPPEASTSTAHKPKMSFLRRGEKAKATFQQEDAKADLKSKNQNIRFYIPNGGETKITFLDGEIKDGMLDIPFFYQHSVHMNGSYNNHFVCTQDEEPCPICEGGNEPSYVGALSVIDHSEWTSKKDGSIHKNEIKMFVAKRNTIKTLLKMAIKRGGLTGCTFDVSRTGDKEAAVGNVFDFSEKTPLKELAQVYGGKGKPPVTPLKYDELISYMPASELRKLNFGSTQGAPVGSEGHPDFSGDM